MIKFYPRLILIFLFAFHLIYDSNGQEKQVSGYVYEAESGESLIGVSVLIKGTTAGVITDLSGFYSINVPADAVLTFSYVGMTPYDQSVENLTTLDVHLRAGIELEDVIVTALGINRSEKSLGYAVSNLKSEDINDSRETNLINALSGKVAGIEISSSSGDVGSSSRIIIRGISNISADNQPLFVVDGVPINNSLRSGSGNIDWGNGISDINTDDIEEMTVLKGAGAAALYGSQGANGVIVIKTKSGKTSKGFGIDFSSSFTMTEPFRLPAFQNKYGPGTDPLGWDFWESGAEPYYAWGPELDAGNMAVQWNSPLGKNGKPIPLPLRSYPDNFKNFFDRGQIFNNSIAFSKGEPGKYHYRLSYNNIQEKGMLPTTGQSRNVVSLNAGANITDKIEVSTSIMYSGTGSDNRLSGNIYALNAVKSAFFMPRSTNIDDLRNYEELLKNGVPLPGDYLGKNEQVVAPGYTMATSDYYPNPFFTLNNLKNVAGVNRWLATAIVNYEITSWLSFDALAGKEFLTEMYEEKCNDGVRHWNGSVYSYMGYYRQNQVTRDNNTLNFKFSAAKSYDKFDIRAFFGGERRDYIMQYSNMLAPELVIAGVFNMSNSQGTTTVTNGYSHKRVNSLYGSADLSLKNGFYLTVTGRNDWSSTLPENNRSYFYPSASFSWVISETLNLPRLFSFAKFRANASQVGADTWPYQLEKSFYNLNRFGNIYEASVENTLKNPNLKPTRINQYEIGLDLRLYENRFAMDLAFYKGNAFDQITPINTASSTGYTYRYVNVGAISNQGIELALNLNLIRKHGFNWDVGATYSKNINEVISLAEDVDALPIGSGYSGIRTEARPGLPYGNIVGYGLKRDPDGNIVHVNGLPVKGDSEQVLGNITPDWIGSITSALSYKKITLSALISGKFGGDLFSNTTQWLRQYGMDEATDVPMRQDYIIGNGVIEKEGANGEMTYIPNNVAVTFFDYSYWMNAYGLHETNIFDASYIKLKEVRLSYNLPGSIIARWPVKQIQVSVVGRNLALLYANIPHIDPETAISADNSKQGFEIFNMPSGRSITFSLVIKL